MQVLIHVDGRSVLIDTGLMPDVADNPAALRDRYDVDPNWIRAVASPDHRIDRQLAQADLAPTDLELVVNTHFHFDHAGGLLAGQLGAAYFIPTFVVPLLLITHGLIFRILLQHQNQSALRESRHPA